MIPLPVPAPFPACQGTGALAHHVHEDIAIGPAPGIFPVGGFTGIGGQVHHAELVILADLHAAEAGEEAFSLVVGRAVVGTVFHGVIHPLHVVLGMHRVVGIRLVSVKI